MEHLSWSAFTPAAFTPESFAAGAVIALFFFWGWDVTLNVSEETRDSGRIPGLAAALAMLVIVSAFMAFAVVTLAVLSEPEIRDSGANIVFAVAEKLVPRPWSYLAVLAVMLSSVGTLETSVLQFARTMFAKARAGEMHRRWSQVHARWRTPHLATWLVSALGLLLLVLALAFPDVDAILKASINAIGLEIAFYYGLTAVACAWHFRRAAARSPGPAAVRSGLAAGERHRTLGRGSAGGTRDGCPRRWQSASAASPSAWSRWPGCAGRVRISSAPNRSMGGPVATMPHAHSRAHQAPTRSVNGAAPRRRLRGIQPP